MIALLFGVASAHVPVIHIVEPDDPDWCGRIAAALGGDLIMFQPGTYTGGCEVTGLEPDYPGELTTIQSFDPNDRPIFVHDGASEFGFHVEGMLVSFLQVTFDGFPESVPAIEYGEGSEMRIRYSTFQDLEVAVQATESVASLYVEHNDFYDVGIAVDAACEGCEHPGLYLFNNLVRGSAGFAVGGSGAQLVDNLVEGADVAFSLQGDGHSMLGNAAWGGESALHVEGSATVANNILAGSAAVEVVAGTPSFRMNTLSGDLTGDLTGAEWVGNALTADVELPEGAADNVICGDSELCFEDSSGGDWFPPPGSPLRGAVAAPTVGVDWCNALRVAPGSAGAFEGEGSASVGSLWLARKDEIGCGSADTTTTPTDTGTDTGTEPNTNLRDTSDTDDPGEDGDDGKGCGCGSAHPTGSLVWWCAAALVIRRSRDR